jgi:hypothetical protein
MTMLVYPQLSTGALCQFPLRKIRRTRTVTNRALDDSTIKLADPAAELTEWILEYRDLSDVEAGALRDFFTAAEGTLNGFTFLDPTGNLLGASGELDGQVWQKDPLLTVTGGVTDPMGGTEAWRLMNGGAAAQVLAQTLAVPGNYEYCLSAYVRSTVPSSARLLVGAETGAHAAGTNWSRAVLAASGAADAESMRFGIQVDAGATLEVYGLQVEPQAAASVYKATTRGGVYSDAHLGSDELNISCTAVNYNACLVKIIHANHI